MIKVGYALTGSFCTIRESLEIMKGLVEKEYDVYPIISYHVKDLSTRFITNEELRNKLKEITGKEPIQSIPEAEPRAARKNFLDVVVVAPCTGNTMAKLANAIIDTPVVMACKSQLRNNKPVVLAIATNDGLSGNAKNLGTLLAIKNYYFVPFSQDDPIVKPFSLISNFKLLNDTIMNALEGKQLQPILLCNHNK